MKRSHSEYSGEVNHAVNLLNARKNNCCRGRDRERGERAPLRVIPPPPVRSFVWTFHGLPSDAFFRVRALARARLSAAVAACTSRG